MANTTAMLVRARQHRLGVLAVQETWESGAADTESVRKLAAVAGYQWFSCRRRGQSAARASGGVGFLVQQGLPVTVMRSSKQCGLLWLRIGRLVIGTVYLPPVQSAYEREAEDGLQELVADAYRYSQQSDVLLLGDFNARVGRLPNNTGDEDEETWARDSQDDKPDPRGRELLQSMNDAGMILLNGLLHNKSTPSATNQHCGGTSVVDMVWANRNLLTSKRVGPLCIDQMPTGHALLWADVERTGAVLADEAKKRTATRQRRWKLHNTDAKWGQFQTEADKLLAEWEQSLPKGADELTADQVRAIIEHGTAAITKAAARTIGYKQQRAERKQIPQFDATVEEWSRKRKRLWQESQQLAANGQPHDALDRECKKLRQDIKKRLRGTLKKKIDGVRKKLAAFQARHPRDYWKMLSILTATGKAAQRSRLPNKVLDELGVGVDGEKALAVWRRAFQVLLNRKSTRLPTAAEAKAEAKIMEDEANDCTNPDRQADINHPITPEEVRDTIMKMCNGKAAGIDCVVAELLKYGGPRVHHAIYRMLHGAFESEVAPRSWTDGLIFPIYKSGTKAPRNNVHNYRGITLLSVVYKVLCRVLLARLEKQCETMRILAEEQYGFRRGRSTVECIYTLTELVRHRREHKKRTIACFIDIAKAYDSVDRQLLWQQIHENGVHGKMFRMLRALYTDTRSCVQVDGQQSTWFNVDVGVRQGCALSPLLFLLFINGLARRLDECKTGVDVDGGPGKLSVMMFADDIVLLAESPEDMQKQLDTLAAFAKERQLQFNYDKSMVVEFHRRSKHRYQLGDRSIDKGDQYAYLGVEVDRSLRWTALKKRLLDKATNAFRRMWAPSSYTRWLSVADVARVWNTCIKPQLEYAAAVWGDYVWEDAERLQRRMARNLLCCPQRTSVDKMYAELGWLPMRAARDRMRLSWWRTLEHLRRQATPQRWAARVFNVTRAWFDRERQFGRRVNTRSWCGATFKLLDRLGSKALWHDVTDVDEPISKYLQKDKAAWTKQVKAAVWAQQQKHWRPTDKRNDQLQRVDYRSLKPKLHGLAAYLRLLPDRRDRALLSRLRCGAHELRSSTWRWDPDGTAKCHCGADETAHHFLLDCKAYEPVRAKVISQMTSEDAGWAMRTWQHRQCRMLLAEGGEYGEGPTAATARAVATFVNAALKLRSQLLQQRRP